jgi:2,3-bisphosphoglycerate-dependent phosphoglycerate mutase
MTTIYFIRHAQSHQSMRIAFSDWPLSTLGQTQAERLAALLTPLGLSRLYCSPFERCQQTVGPFVGQSGLEPLFHDDLRERYFAPLRQDGFADVWYRSWQDFDFAVPGYESNRAAQRRFVKAVREIARTHPGESIGICTHGNVIGLFLHHLHDGHGREVTEAIRNPDVLKLTHVGDGFEWDRNYRLEGLDDIASHHDSTPKAFD